MRSSLRTLHGNRKQYGASMTAWQQAQVDVCHLLCDAKTLSESPAQPAALGDFCQTAGRGAIHVAGTLPCLTTSSCIWSYGLHRELQPEELYGAHGFEDYDFGGMTVPEAVAAVGNSMAASSLAVVLVPVLEVLGKLVPVGAAK